MESVEKVAFSHFFWEIAGRLPLNGPALAGALNTGHA